ncbi:MAG TPA: glycosyltransferase family 2 protein [Armatimonadota bacterium]|nr:glycosyltransferase family 2 protein [Armatimonadota bacterium]
MDVSIVIPIYNEEESLPILHQALHAALDNHDFTWEAVLVDDGSADKSAEIIDHFATIDPEHMVSVIFRRNFGQTAAMAAGIDHAIGEIIVLMDADLQNDPADIPMMLDKIREGYDVVSGWRANRQDTYVTRTFPSRIANWLISRVTGVYLHDYGCSLKAYRREVITGFRLYGEMHRFIPAYANSVGAKIVEVPVHHHARKFGKAKYGLERIAKVILDLFTVKFLTSYAGKPIYLFGGTGLCLIAASFIPLLYLVINRLCTSGLDAHINRSPLLLLSVMFFILGFQCILMGLIAELLARTYHESQNKPAYKVRRVTRNNVSSMEHDLR